MSEDRGPQTADGGRERGPALRGLVLLAALAASGSGCRTVVDTVAGVFGPGVQAGESLDAHVVYRLRPGCPSLLARSMRHGYTVLTPGPAPEGIENREAFVGTGFEETGVFEGPVREGEVVFRYIPPAESATRRGEPIDVVAMVDAVGLTLPQGHERLTALCGREAEGEAPDPAIPRVPGQAAGP